MVSYGISLTTDENRTAIKAASETGMEVSKYISHIVKEHLENLEGKAE